MSKKGFTLIELLGVFTVLAIIMVISLPAITKNLKNNDIKKFDSFKESAALATETYIESNRDKYPSLKTAGSTVNITIGTLKQENLLTDIPKKPDGTIITDSMVVKVTVNSDLTLKYEFQG